MVSNLKVGIRMDRSYTTMSTLPGGANDIEKIVKHEFSEFSAGDCRNIPNFINWNAG
jgi:hypothetical protein